MRGEGSIIKEAGDGLSREINRGNFLKNNAISFASS